MEKKKVILGLSGGVDSAVSAQLLLDQGYEVDAVYLMCWNEPGCRAEDDRKDAMKVALQLGLKFKVLDFRADYKKRVMDYFYKEYGEGRTPNPDVLCNREVKFGLFYEWAMEHGYDYMATGHYARIQDGKLMTPKDLKKDQTYFLYQVRGEQLEHVLFPLGDLMKREVRARALEMKLPVSNKKDSMGICFVGDVDVRAMLVEKYGVRKGDLQLVDGTVVGEHDGYWLFTVGQRGGFQLRVRDPKVVINGMEYDRTMMPKLYVVDVRKDDNVVVLGVREEALRRKFEIAERHMIGESSLDGDLYVKIRNTGKMVGAEFESLGDARYEVRLREDEFGVSPGQHCVVYKKIDDRYEVMGGGVIC